MVLPRSVERRKPGAYNYDQEPFRVEVKPLWPLHALQECRNQCKFLGHDNGGIVLQVCPDVTA